MAAAARRGHGRSRISRFDRSDHYASPSIAQAAKISKHSFWIASDDSKICPGGLVRLRTSLLPIPERSDRNMVSRCKFFLGQTERATQGFDPGDTLRRRQLLWRHRARVRIGRRRCRDFRFTHGTHGRLGERSLMPAVERLDDRAVRSNSRGNSGPVHVAPPVGLK